MNKLELSTEDYVSYETAKLLKEKGFDIECDYLYVNGNIVRAQGFGYNWNKGETIFTDYKNECSAPTLQIAMKWLREKHKITIGIVFKGDRIYYEIHQNNEFVFGVDTPKSYEKVCDEAIKYCLTELT